MQICYNFSSWRDGRVDEGAGLENRYGFIPIVGSNPTLSATILAILVETDFH